MSITPKNWRDFQHYKDRNPPWIRLHKKLLDDFEFHRLPVASKALAPCLWLLASEVVNGEIALSVEQLAFRVRMTEPDFLEALKPLIDEGFFTLNQYASAVLAERLRDAVPMHCISSHSISSQRKTARAAPMAAPEFSPEFLEAWAKYPKRDGANKRQTLKAWQARIKAGVDPAVMIAGCVAYRLHCEAHQTEPQFIKQPATFFGPDEHYLTDWATTVNGTHRNGNSQTAMLQNATRNFFPPQESQNDPAIIDVTPAPSRVLGR